MQQLIFHSAIAFSNAYTFLDRNFVLLPLCFLLINISETLVLRYLRIAIRRVPFPLSKHARSSPSSLLSSEPRRPPVLSSSLHFDCTDDEMGAALEIDGQHRPFGIRHSTIYFCRWCIWPRALSFKFEASASLLSIYFFCIRKT